MRGPLFVKELEPRNAGMSGELRGLDILDTINLYISPQALGNRPMAKTRGSGPRNRGSTPCSPAIIF